MMMRKEKIAQIIESHIEKQTDFEAALELLCVVMIELKNNVSEMLEQKERKPEISKIKKILEHDLPARFSEDELVFLGSFIEKNIILCEKLLAEDED